MATDTELLEALRAPEIKPLIEDAPAVARDLLERDLLRRRDEIELELSTATAARDQARANHTQARVRITASLKEGAHQNWLGASQLVLGAALLGASASWLFGWATGLGLIGAWRAPFSSGWLAAAVWLVIYTAVVVLVVEVDFATRRLPRRRTAAAKVENIPALEKAANEADEARRSQMLRLVSEHVTEIINASQGPRFAAELQTGSVGPAGAGRAITLATGLSEVSNDNNRVATDAQQRLLGMLGTLPGASLGISGPRGVGKSTLLATLCGANPTIQGRPAIAILTSAPIEYDAREFLLHLFSTLCRQVLRTQGDEAAIEREQPALAEARNWRRASLRESSRSAAPLLALVGGPLVAVSILLALLQAPLGSAKTTASPATQAAAREATGKAAARQQPSAKQLGSRVPTPPASSPQAQAQPKGSSVPVTPSVPDTEATGIGDGIAHTLAESGLFTFGAIALALSFAAWLIGSRFGWYFLGKEPLQRSYFGGEHYRLVSRAMHELRNIGFQRSYTSGWSGSLKVPAGFEMGSTAGVTLAQQPETLPELVERFRSFVRDVAISYDNVVLIGIDELDKLQSAQQAEAFLNGLKSVFGIPRCFYLVSVSEHALAAFERRGLGFRDAFDSALDDVIRLHFLTLEQSRLLLNRRVLRLPDPFLQLCHMLSGGLPRDLIRHARALLDGAHAAPQGRLTMKQAADLMAARDLEARVHATSIEIRSLNEIRETSGVLVELERLPSSASISAATAALARFRRYLSGLPTLTDTADGRALLRRAGELAVYYDSIILLRRVAALLSTQEGWKRATALNLADEVAHSRQAVEVGVPVAEFHLAELRKIVDKSAREIDGVVNPHLRRRQPAKAPSPARNGHANKSRRSRPGKST